MSSEIQFFEKWLDSLSEAKRKEVLNHIWNTHWKRNEGLFAGPAPRGENKGFNSGPAPSSGSRTCSTCGRPF